MRLLAAAACLLLAGAAIAQAPGASSGGTVTNPPAVPGADEPGAPAPEHDSPPAHGAEPDVHHGDTTVRQQAEARRREALEQCQALTGASRIDCVKRAEADYRRAISEDTLSDRGPGPSLG